jgi:hypothetical protein
MHVCGTAVLGVAERFADDAATAQRRTEAMGYGRRERGEEARRAGVRSEESGGGGGRQRVPAPPRKYLTEYPTEYPSRQRGSGGGRQRALPDCLRSTHKEYSRSTPQGTQVGKGGADGQRVSADSSAHCGGSATPARPIAAAHIQPTHKDTRTRNLLRGGSAFHHVVALVCVGSTGAGSHGSAHAARPAPKCSRSKGLNGHSGRVRHCPVFSTNGSFLIRKAPLTSAGHSTLTPGACACMRMCVCVKGCACTRARACVCVRMRVRVCVRVCLPVGAGGMCVRVLRERECVCVLTSMPGWVRVVCMGTRGCARVYCACRLCVRVRP